MKDSYCSASTARKWSGWAEAFAIFAKYSDDTDTVSAEHDEVFAGPNPKVVSKVDEARLMELGWRPDEKNECFSKFT